LVTLPLEGVPGKVAGVQAVDDQAAKDPNYLKDPQNAVAAKAAEEYRADPITMGIQHAPSDRVASATAQVIFPGFGAAAMAIAIIVSTFGCNNGLILTGARAYYAMARDGLFFKSAGNLNRSHVPAWGLWIQGAWSAFYILPRTVRTAKDGTISYGNLYGDLLTYVISAALIFYILTIAGVYVLRAKRPDAERPYRAFGYPIVPALYIVGAAVILFVLFAYQTATTWPGLIIVLAGVPVYFIWRKRGTVAAKPLIS
ncbi:MAG: hypothetical protein DME19_19930, partial [Verrucomicrobia bacterium]